MGLNRKHCVVSLSTLKPLLSSGLTQETSRHDSKFVDWDVKYHLEQNFRVPMHRQGAYFADS